jgi:preprotein translocase subunit YajC
MDLCGLIGLLALAQPPQPGQKAPPFWVNAVPMVLLVGVFYLALLRPSQQKAKQQAALLKAVRSGDKIVTNSGIVGVVVTVKDKTLSIRSADSKFEITKTAVAEITERSGEAGETKSVP